MVALPITFVSHTGQASLLASWNFSLVRPENKDDGETLHNQCPTLFILTLAATKYLPPENVGIIFSVIRKCAVCLNLLLQKPLSSSQLQRYCAEIGAFVVMRCPEQMVLDLAKAVVLELAFYLKEMVGCEPSLHGERAGDTSLRFSDRFFNALLDEHRAVFRQIYTFRDFFTLIRGFRHENCAEDRLLADLISTDVVQLHLEDQEANAGPAGHRVPFGEFCIPADKVPEKAACLPCTASIAVKEEGENAVVAKCGHFFHGECLSLWVNDSDMNDFNTCPSCHAIMCASRSHVHESYLHQS